MAAKPLDPIIVDDILTDWRMGQLSQQQIAEKRKVSKGAVNKICKGVEQDVLPIVTALISSQQALHAHDDRMVTAVTAVIDEAVQRMDWLNKANMTVANLTMRKLAIDKEAASYQDLNAASTTLGRTKDNVFGKAPETAIQVNNTFPREINVISGRA